MDAIFDTGIYIPYELRPKAYAWLQQNNTEHSLNELTKSVTVENFEELVKVSVWNDLENNPWSHSDESDVH